MIKTLVTALLAVAFGVTGASAETLGQQSRLETTFGVIDLTPADGQEAGFTFGAIETTYLLDLYVAGEVNQRLRETVTGTAPSQFALSHGDVTTSVAFTGIPGHLTMSSYQSDERDIVTDGTAWQELMITVAPHTLFTVSGRYVTDETRTDTPHIDQYMAAEISIWSGLETHFYYLDRRNGPTGHETSNYWLAYANTANEAANIVVYTRLSQQMRVVEVSPVPEPSTWAMLLAGLGVAATVARRRR